MQMLMVSHERNICFRIDHEKINDNIRNAVDTFAIGMGDIFLQCHAIARFCNAMASLLADALIGHSLIFRRGDRPTPCRTRAKASRAQASFAVNSAVRKLDPSSSGLVRSASYSSSFSREHSLARRAPRYGRHLSHRRRAPHRDGAQAPSVARAFPVSTPPIAALQFDVELRAD